MPRLRSPLALTGTVAALMLAACSTPYTSPVQVTRFTAPEAASLGTGSIVTEVDSANGEQLSGTVYASAVASELARVGYSVGQDPQPPLVATIRVERTTMGGAVGGNSPVSVGVGGQTGSFGSGVGLGVGINLGGSRNTRREITRLSVRLDDRATGKAVWEGRAEIATSPDSPYAQPQANARALASALFRGFPGGNGETVTVDVKKLQGN